MAGGNNKAIMFDGDAYEKNHGLWSRAVGRDLSIGSICQTVCDGSM